MKQVIQFDGDRWSGADWLAFRKDRVTWRDHFVCSRDICLVGKTVVFPAGGRTVFLDDAGDRQGRVAYHQVLRDVEMYTQRPRRPQASGFVVSQTYGTASQKLPAVWERP